MADLQSRAIEIVRSERDNWQDATAFITEKVAFQMRNLIRQLRKNYWGVFDKPNDPVTGRKKFWYPLTRIYVENVVKNIDLDTKDINFRAKNPQSVELTAILRNLTKNRLDAMFFGEDLDKMERQLAIDGTVVWKTLKTKDGMDLRQVDLLNFYIDPTANSIHEAERVTERAVMDINEIQAMDWENTDDLQPVDGISRTEDRLNATTSAVSSGNLRDVWEMWGTIPESLITGEIPEDGKEKMVKGRIVVSGLEKNGDERVHLIERVKDIPYEEAWYTRANGRWYGIGVAESLVMSQLYINTIINIRVTRSFLSQQGIYKIRKNSGITPQMMSKLSVNGAITVNSMDDIEQFIIQEASQSSYIDETNINNIADRLTSAFEVATGEALPASTSATATAIQNRSAQSQFILIKEGIGMFLQRWLKRHGVPIIIETTSKEDLVRVSGDGEELRGMDERIAVRKVAKEAKKRQEAGELVEPESLMKEAKRLASKFKESGADRFVKLMEEIDPFKYDVQVFVTNEEVDKGILAQNLLGAMQIAPEFREPIVRQLFDIMGLDANTLKATAVPQTAPQGQQGGQPTQNPQVQLTNANTV